jgi:hypothetical protein
MRRLLLLSVLVVATTPLLRAQAPDFRGTWRLDASKSTIVPAATFFGLIPNGVPEMLHITQPANGTIAIESQIREGHSRLYRPGGKMTTPAGQGGTITVTSRWDGRTLIAEGAQKAPSGTSIDVKESIALSADGKTLTVEVTTAAAGGEKQTSTAIYTRTQDLGPCEKWPIPCKRRQ